MMKCLTVSAKVKKNGPTEIYPKFKIIDSSDLMIRGGDFYAVWVEERALWSTKEQDLIHLVDEEVRKYAEDYEAKHAEEEVIKMYMEDSES